MPRTRGQDWRLTTEQVDLRAWLRQQWWSQWSECATLWLPTDQNVAGEFNQTLCCWTQAGSLISMTFSLYLQIKISQGMSSLFQVIFIEKVLDCNFVIWAGASVQRGPCNLFLSFPSTVVQSHETLCRQKHSVASSLPVASSHYLPSACLSVGVWRWGCCLI